jgi:hypothetical protein
MGFIIPLVLLGMLARVSLIIDVVCAPVTA